jgi:hypothetical protein
MKDEHQKLDVNMTAGLSVPIVARRRRRPFAHAFRRLRCALLGHDLSAWPIDDTRHGCWRCGGLIIPKARP